jgi:hypothetical protein
MMANLGTKKGRQMTLDGLTDPGFIERKRAKFGL